MLKRIASTGVNPLRLRLELTESLLLSDAEGAIAKMLELKAHGIGFALDDLAPAIRPWPTCGVCRWICSRSTAPLCATS